ncbi:hypothetical protein Leryth_006658 [Lithospermum erythrorhizon]|nr:hypothetical protein Leryth_006658 [Lithospermum erythrorhizon]
MDDNIMSRRGRGLLFRHTSNVVEGPAEDRQMISGIHNVADVFCSDCQECLGWKYIKTIHKYKEGRTVITKSKIAKAFDPPFHT